MLAVETHLKFDGAKLQTYKLSIEHAFKQIIKHGWWEWKLSWKYRQDAGYFNSTQECGMLNSWEKGDYCWNSYFS